MQCTCTVCIICTINMYMHACMCTYVHILCTCHVHCKYSINLKEKSCKKNVHIVPHVRNETPLLAQAFLGSDPQFPTSTFQSIFYVHSIGVTLILAHFLYYVKSL